MCDSSYHVTFRTKWDNIFRTKRVHQKINLQITLLKIADKRKKLSFFKLPTSNLYKPIQGINCQRCMYNKNWIFLLLKDNLSLISVNSASYRLLSQSATELSFNLIYGGNQTIYIYINYYLYQRAQNADSNKGSPEASSMNQVSYERATISITRTLFYRKVFPRLATASLTNAKCKLKDPCPCEVLYITIQLSSWSRERSNNLFSICIHQFISSS